MSKSKAEIEKDLLSFRNEILENQDSYEKIHDISNRIISYYFINHLTAEDMHVLEDPVLIEIQNRATDQWFASMLNPTYRGGTMKMPYIINITPYREIRGGEQSIYDHIDLTAIVPDKVIAYLRTTNPALMSPGIYDHPFKKGKQLLGPYKYTDGKYMWDRDTWKYVVKYGLTLPQEFIDHVMSDEGTRFIEKCIDEEPSWCKAIKQWKKRKGFVCFLPDDAGDLELEKF